MKFYIYYTVVGFGANPSKDCIAGPYSPRSEAEYQHDDIAGYQGVCNARIVDGATFEADLLQAAIGLL